MNLNNLTQQTESMPTNTKKPTRIVVMGDLGVGKSAIVTRCIKNKFYKSLVSGRDLSYRYNANFGKKPVPLDVVDFNGKNDALISCADGFILCYSITDRKSFDAIDDYLDKIVDANIKHPKITIIGNKSDLYRDREVTSAEGFLLAKEINGQFYETSAKIPVIDIRQVFYDLYKAIKNSKKIRKDKKDSFDYESSDDYGITDQAMLNSSGLLGYSRCSQRGYLSGLREMSRKLSSRPRRLTIDSSL